MQQEVSLFIGLVPGTKVDLAVAARATLAFDAALKELAFKLDPFSQVSIELESSTEGSQKINALIRVAKAKVTDPRFLRAAAFAMLCWFADDVRSYLSERAIEQIIAEEEPTLSPAEIAEIAQAVRQALLGGAAEREMKQVLRELQQDTHVTEVGVSPKKNKRPALTLPAGSFTERIHEPTVTPASNFDVTTKTERLNLISPVLLPGERRWRFSYHEGEFGAPILDKAFLQRLLTGKEPVAMTAGIQMTVILETKYQIIDGMRIAQDRRILEVLNVERPYRQSHLDF